MYCFLTVFHVFDIQCRSNVRLQDGIIKLLKNFDSKRKNYISDLTKAKGLRRKFDISKFNEQYFDTQKTFDILLLDQITQLPKQDKRQYLGSSLTKFLELKQTPLKVLGINEIAKAKRERAIKKQEQLQARREKWLEEKRKNARKTEWTIEELEELMEDFENNEGEIVPEYKPINYRQSRRRLPKKETEQISLGFKPTFKSAIQVGIRFGLSNEGIQEMLVSILDEVNLGHYAVSDTTIWRRRRQLLRHVNYDLLKLISEGRQMGLNVIP